LAKLDFFVRYPDFFKQIQLHLSEDKGSALNLDTANTGLVESSMIRYKYGPWDSRYYQLLAYLEGRRLLEVTKGSKGSFVFKLTEAGLEIARRFAQEDSYSELCQHMKEVKDLIGGKSGGVLKSLIYKVFDKEIASLPMGEIIRHDTKDIHNKIS
jgi:DNA-binding PadR family transcriptional regulator